MSMRAGKARAIEHQWRAAPRVVAKAATPRPQLKDNRGFWLAVCVAIAFAVALLR